MSPEGGELQENMEAAETTDGKETETEKVKSKTRKSLENLMLAAGVIGILMAPGAAGAAKEKLNNWGDLKDKISDLESGEQIQLKMTQEKLDELEPKIQDEGCKVKEKDNGIIVIEKKEQTLGGVSMSEFEADAEETLQEEKKETQQTEEELEREEKETENLMDKEMQMVLATVDKDEMKQSIAEDINGLVDKVKNEKEITNAELDEILSRVEALHNKQGSFKEENREGLVMVIDFIHMRVERRGDSPEIENKLNKLEEIEEKIK